MTEGAESKYDNLPFGNFVSVQIHGSTIIQNIFRPLPMTLEGWGNASIWWFSASVHAYYLTLVKVEGKLN